MKYKFSDDHHYFAGRALSNFENIVLPMKNRNSPLRFLELGVAEGRCSTWMLDNVLTHTDSTLDCVDLHLWENTMHNLKSHIDAKKCRVFNEYTYTALAKMLCEGGQYDFIYIDACHRSCNVIQDAVMSFPMLKTGGIMAFDDYEWFDPKYASSLIETPKPAIDFFLSSFSEQLKVIYKKYQVYVLKE